MFHKPMNLKINTLLIIGLMYFAIFSGTSVFAQEAAATATTTAVDSAAGVASNAAATDPGMQIPVDGSSLEAFNTSLETIKAQASAPNFITLEGAIQFLLVYDLSANRDKGKLAKNLDGMTGAEIVEQVEARKR